MEEPSADLWSLEDLASELDEQLVIRRRELGELLHDLEALEPGPTLDAHLRACWVLVYAHWEGFANAAIACYVRLFAARRPPLHAVPIGLRAIALRQALPSGVQRIRLDDALKAARATLADGALFDVSPERVKRFAWRDMDWPALQQAVEVIGGGMGRFGEGARAAIRNLYKVRNRIAHGVDLEAPPLSSLRACYEHVDFAMRALQQEVVDSAARHEAELLAAPTA